MTGSSSQESTERVHRRRRRCAGWKVFAVAVPCSSRCWPPSSRGGGICKDPLFNADQQCSVNFGGWMHVGFGGASVSFACRSVGFGPQPLTSQPCTNAQPEKGRRATPCPRFVLVLRGRRVSIAIPPRDGHNFPAFSSVELIFIDGPANVRCSSAAAGFICGRSLTPSIPDRRYYGHRQW